MVTPTTNPEMEARQQIVKGSKLLAIPIAIARQLAATADSRPIGSRGLLSRILFRAVID